MAYMQFAVNDIKDKKSKHYCQDIAQMSHPSMANLSNFIQMQPIAVKFNGMTTNYTFY